MEREEREERGRGEGKGGGALEAHEPAGGKGSFNPDPLVALKIAFFGSWVRVTVKLSGRRREKREKDVFWMRR